MVPLFSFIVPIYNAQSYLADCLSSIRKQKFTDFEAILLDDGSEDESGKIAASFSASDSRFVYIRQENQGTSGATNAAFLAAKGKYLINLDDDDYAHSNLLTKCKEVIGKYEPDVIQFQCVYMNELGLERDRQSFLKNELVFEGHENLQHCERVMPGAFNRTHSRKVFRHDVIADIRFVGTSKGADTSFLRRALFRCEKAVLLPHCYFYVREIQTSESRKPNPLYLYKEWFDRELSDLSWCINENQVLKRTIPFWEFDDLLDMFQLFAAKAYRDGVFDERYFKSLSKSIWARRRSLMKKGPAEWARWFFWIKNTKSFAKISIVRIRTPKIPHFVSTPERSADAGAGATG